MALRQPNWTRILTILLVILAAIALVYISISVLERFASAIVLLIVGALVAYVMTPLANRLTNAFHFRWLGILLAYCMVAVGFFAVGVLLFTPFIEQSQSLVNNLHNPSPASVARIARVRNEATYLERVLKTQQSRVTRGGRISVARIRGLQPALQTLERNVQDIATGISGTGRIKRPRAHGTNAVGNGRSPASPPPSIRVPPSYTAPLTADAGQLSIDYGQLLSVTAGSGPIDPALIGSVAGDAKRTEASAASAYQTMSTTPILLLRAQNWLDQHHIRIDLSNKFGQAAQQLSAQGTDILNNAITILSETATILLDFALVLIISFYLLADGDAMIQRALDLVPSSGREQAYFFVASLDGVLGGYIRGQLILSILAGILGGGGAEMLGVPYPLLIGLMTSLLELVPVIGPMVAAIPAVAIALFFTPVFTAVILLVWFVVFQQIVTNLVGPRIMGIAVGISPIEAILAVLVGYPVGGFLGAFLAVPVAGILHILIREAYSYFVLGKALPSKELPESEPDRAASPTVVAPPKPDSAASS